MAQFDVYEIITNGPERFLLDVQHDLMGDLSTRLVVPLVDQTAVTAPIGDLNPVFLVNGVQVVLSPPEMAGVTTTSLGRCVGSLAGERTTIIRAIDTLITGP